MKRIAIYLMLALGLTLTTTSCVKDELDSLKEPERYTRQDVQSYAELFDVFWNVMNQRFNYLAEQERKDGKSWQDIYNEYYPKFKALKVYDEGSNAQIAENYDKADQYFTEIINPMIDVHFYVKISMPYTNDGINYIKTYYGGMEDDSEHYINVFSRRYNYMKDRLINPFLAPETFMSGALKSNPAIYYISFGQFNLRGNFKISLDDEYLSPDEGNALVVTPQNIEERIDTSAIPEAQKAQVKDHLINILNQWNALPNSNEVKAFNEGVTAFNNTDIITDDFLALTQTVLDMANNTIDPTNPSLYYPILNNQTLPVIKWFINEMYNHVNYGYLLGDFKAAANQILQRAPFYQQVLNPLQNGDFKKIIIDLRGNGGGAVLDARFFTDRFITKNALYAYQRTKEGNGTFNYTPWVPLHTTPGKFNIPKEVPIAILTDKGSASMSEISTLMLKSQGAQVVSIGEYSAGATAGLTGDPDEFNGGLVNTGFFDTRIAGVFTFYMPTVATQNAEGEVIEGIGIKPDIPVKSLTRAEVIEMINSPNTFTDRTLETAIKYLSSK